MSIAASGCNPPVAFMLPRHLFPAAHLVVPEQDDDHLENRCTLDRILAPFRFTVCVFPITERRASAAPVRAGVITHDGRVLTAVHPRIE